MQIGILIAQILLKYGPQVAEAITIALHKDAPTLEDWQAVFAKIKTYEEYVAPEK